MPPASSERTTPELTCIISYLTTLYCNVSNIYIYNSIIYHQHEDASSLQGLVQSRENVARAGPH